MTTPNRPLSGVKVVALEQYIAAPYCTMWLADYGAEVIKVERPGGGDPRRSYEPLIFDEAGENFTSGGFFSYNRNKRSAVIDLTTDEGRERYLELVADADVVVENLRPGAVDKLGLGYEDLKKVNPRLIYAAISGYGRTPGLPYTTRPAFDAAILAMSGITQLTGDDPERPPQMPMYALADMFSGVTAGYQIMLSLFDRERSGEGRYIDVSMYESLLALNERSVISHQFTGIVPQRGPDKYQAPVGAYETKTGYVAMVVPNDAIWQRLATVVGREDWKTDSRTATGEARSANADAFDGDLRAWFSTRTREEAVEQLEAEGVPVGAVQTTADLLECPHLTARGAFVEVDDPIAGRIRAPHAPDGMSGYGPVPNHTIPVYGEMAKEESR